MSAVPLPQKSPSAAPAPGASAASRAWLRIEAPLARWVDAANPILVKETRQALKSRQFAVTFLVVLVACWVVTFVGVALVGPQIYYAAAGPQLLVAYYLVLAFPLAVIVPFTAFRSLAAEQEENTYDLLSITSLTSRQIVTGKLWSAAVQMLVYLCAVSPCLAFTFLLRGVDAATVAVLLAVAALGCLGLSMAALLVGAIARLRSTQAVVSVALVLALFWTFVGAFHMASDFAEGGLYGWGTPSLWMLAAGALAYVTTFGLVHAAAAAQIAFASENRATPLRRWMFAQQLCACGWLGAAAYEFFNEPMMITGSLMMAAGAGGLYWYFMGALMTGEWPHLSRRVQRSLPQATPARVLLSFFSPGPSGGYLFAVANMAGLVVLGLGVLKFGEWRGVNWSMDDRAWYALSLAWAYVTAFLGLGLAAINLLRRWAYVPLTAAFLTHMVLLLAGVGIPTVVQLMSRQLRYGGYSLIQVSNPFWTLAELTTRGPNAIEAPTVLIIVGGTAVAALLMNMRAVAAELRHQRVATPLRIAEEDALLRAQQKAAGPTNPWEADETDAANSRHQDDAG